MTKSSRGWLIGIIISFFLLIYFLSPIITPFFIAALFAYLGNPLVKKLINLKLPRALAVSIVFILFLLIIIGLLLWLVPLLERQIAILFEKLPELFSWIQNTAIPWVTKTFHIDDVFNVAKLKTFIIEHWEEAGSFATTVVTTVTTSGYTFFVFLLNLVLIPVVTFYFLRDWEKLIKGITHLIPVKFKPLILKLADESNEVIGAFFRGQLLVMISLAIYYSVALSIMGLQLALLIGLIIGIITIVPYLGFIVGIVLALLATVLQFQDWIHILYVIIIFAAGNIIENYFLSPLLVGDRIGLHPVAVIFAVLAGGQLFGFIGVLLALPVAAVIMVLLRYVTKKYYASDLYGKTENE